jgi:exocyst complex component 4
MLHVEIRYHEFFYVNKSLGRTFYLDQDAVEPDPEIVSLNSDLVTFDEELANHLHPKQQS